jgi:hypothetical protein
LRFLLSLSLSLSSSTCFLDVVGRGFSKHDDTSDALKSLSAICAYGYASDGDAFSEKMFDEASCDDLLEGLDLFL